MKKFQDHFMIVKPGLIVLSCLALFYPHEGRSGTTLAPGSKALSGKVEPLYYVAFIYYEENGKKKMQEFTQQAAPLFKKYGVLVGHFINPLDKEAVTGQANDFSLPDKGHIFFVDTPEGLNQYTPDQISQNQKHPRGWRI